MRKDRTTIILYDGDCTLCNRYVKFVIKHTPDKTFNFFSMSSNNGVNLLKSVNLKGNINQTIILIEEDSIKIKSNAILRIVSKLHFPYRIFVLGYIIPKIIRDKIYDLVALNRHKLFTSPSCVKK